jgi:hypothetical protein
VAKTLAQMATEIRENNIEKGWRSPDGGPGSNTWGDYVALLHSEISEALEAYRDHRLEDATGPGALHVRHNVRIPPKPEGVGSEFADVLIRLIDMCDVFGLWWFDMDWELADAAPAEVGSAIRTFGDWMSYLHERVTDLWNRPDLAHAVLRGLVAVSERYGIDLTAEYERKITYNRTRTFQHGGRTLADNL